MTVWLVRAGAHGEQEDLALQERIACVAADDVPDLAPHKTRVAIEQVLREVHPADGNGRIRNNAAQLHAFAHGIAKGDLVVLPLKTRAQIALGRLTGEYKFRTDLGPGARHTRPVKWVRTDVSRTTFGQDLLYSFGAFMTVCRISRNDAGTRIQAVLDGQPDPGLAESDVPDNEGSEEVAGERDVEVDAGDQILRYVIQHFKGHEMARLVDAVLRAEGYHTKLSPAGPDGGVDILASRGSLGLDGPRLCVQVKSSEAPADVKILRELQGSMARFKAEHGLLVSWGGLTNPADREARDSFFSVRVWDSRELLQAVFRNYDRLAEDVRAELPLKRVWALVPERMEE
jgi:restriction system protein